MTSRMRREFHVRFCENGGVKVPTVIRHAQPNKTTIYIDGFTK